VTARRVAGDVVEAVEGLYRPPAPNPAHTFSDRDIAAAWLLRGCAELTGYVVALALVLGVLFASCGGFSSDAQSRATSSPYAPTQAIVEPAPSYTGAPRVPRITDGPSEAQDGAPDCDDADPADPEIDVDVDCVP
jgi:hypothetical protein